MTPRQPVPAAAEFAASTADPVTATSDAAPSAKVTATSGAAVNAAANVAANADQGYWLVAADGGIFTFGNAGYFGSTGGIRLNQPIVGMAATPDGRGYWLVAADGGIFAFGDADFYGSTGAITLNQPIVGMAATPDGRGYWLVAADGGVFAFGDAGYYGSTGAIRLNQPIVGMAATPDGRGYWLVAADGGIFAFGDADFYGSTGAIKLNQPIVGMAAAPDGRGYWLVAADGGVFAFGDAGYFGSAPSINPQDAGIVGLSPTSNGQGYWTAGSNGAVNAFGSAAPEGSTAGFSSNKPIVGSAAVPSAVPSPASPAPLSVTVTPLAAATDGSPYTASLAASGGTAPYSWILIGGSLPSGLSLSSSGVISGTPRVSGTFTFTVQVTDSTTPTPLTATAARSISVASPPLSLTTTTLPNAIGGTAYSTALAVAGGTSPYAWAVTSGTLPAGLTLSAGGTITGTPSGQGSSSFTVRVTDASRTPLVASATLSIVVFPPTSSVSTASSLNWSGYIEENGPFTSVTGTFSVPSLLPNTPTSDLMAEWVGIDGGNGGNSLIQAGFNETPDPHDPGNPKGFVIQPWWEILPAPETYITNVSIQPGDEVTVAITQIGGTQWRITLTDDNHGGTFTIDRTYTGTASHRGVDPRGAHGQRERRPACAVLAGRRVRRSRIYRPQRRPPKGRHGAEQQSGRNALDAHRQRIQRGLRQQRPPAPLSPSPLESSVLLLPQDTVHLRPTRRAQTLRGPAAVGQLDLLPIEFTLFAALHAVALKICHANSSFR